MKNLKQAITTCLFILTALASAQVEITNDKISNLEVTNSGFITLFGNLNYDSYAHNFLFNGQDILSVGNLGIDMQSNTRITRQQPGGFKVDLLPYAMGTISHAASSSTLLSNDTGNFSANGNNSGVITITFADASVITSELVVHVTPFATDITPASQVSLNLNNNNTMQVFLYTPSGSSISNYGMNIIAYKP